MSFPDNLAVNEKPRKGKGKPNGIPFSNVMPQPLVTLLLYNDSLADYVVISATNSFGKHHYTLIQLAAVSLHY